MIARIAGFALAAALAPAVAAQDFTLTLQPNSVTLIPDKTASFLVSLTPVGGFTSRVEWPSERFRPAFRRAFRPIR